MLRRLLCGAFAALTLVSMSSALASGPAPTAMQGGNGLLAVGGGVRYVALPAEANTVLAAVDRHTGRIARSAVLEGSWGIPVVTVGGATGGLSADGRTLILAEASPQGEPLRKQSTFLVIEPSTLQLMAFVQLRGDFAYDALSPDGRVLYLIEHMSVNDLSRYVVRAYDLDRQALLPQAIADKTQRGWVMAGYPISRLAGPGGRWVYTLYTRGGGYPFVHALDTVNGVAHCIGVPWHGDQSGLAGLRLSLRDGGGTFALDRRDGSRFLAVDTRTFATSHPASEIRSWLRWWVVLIGAVGLALLLAAAVRRRALLRAARRLRTRGAVPAHGA